VRPGRFALSAEWRALAPIMVTSTLVGMTISLAIPLLSLALERAGVDPFTIGINTAANGLGIFLVAPFIGRLVAGLGVVGCFRSALAVMAACMLAFPLKVDPTLWFLLRLVFGAAAGLMFVLSEAAVNAMAPESIRGRVLGVYATLFSLGFASGPLVLALAGSEGWTPFLLGGALFVLGMVPAGMLRAVGSRLAAEPGGGTHRLADTWRVAPLAMAGVFAYAMLEAAQFALLPVYALGRGVSEAMAAGLLSIWLSGNILLQYPLGWLADRWRRQRVMVLCVGLAMAGQLLVPLAFATPALLWPLLMLLGGVMGGLYTLSLVLIGERFRGADLTQANTAFVMTFQLGTIAGPPFTGAAMRELGVASFPLALLAPLLVLALVLLLRQRPVAVPLGDP
jgi:MFS family permease